MAESTENEPLNGETADAAARGGVFHVIRQVLAALAVIVPVAWVLDLPRQVFGLVFYTEQLLGFELALVLPLLYLSFDWRRQRVSRPHWYDVVLAAAGAGAAGYLAVTYPTLVNDIVFLPLYGVILAVTLIVLSVEGVRRATGWTLALIVLFFIAFGFFGHFLPDPYASREVGFSRLAVYLGLDTNALLGTALQVAIIVIVPFILLGRLLAAAGGSEFFTALAMAAMGRYRGGAGKIAVMGSSLFGSISGAAVANVAGTGVVTIPLMKRGGFPARIAAGIEAVASTGGQLMPPVIGASAFLMAEFLGLPYGEVMLAALLPIILYYVAVFVQVDLMAAKLGIAGIPKSERPPLGPEIRAGWHFLLPFAVFLFGIFYFGMQPEEAVLYAIGTLLVTSLVFGYHGRRVNPRILWRALTETGHSCLELIIITAAAGLVIGVLNLTGAAFSLSLQLVSLSGGNIALLMIMAAVASIILGMGMPTVGVYILLATLIAPAMEEAGIMPLAAHMFVLYFGMLSMVTPPIAIAAFAAANIGGAPPWETAAAAMRLGWTAYIVPFLFVMSPSLLLVGSLGDALQAAATGIVGVTFVTMAIVGYARDALGPVMRIWTGAAGLMLLIPASAFTGALIVEIAGALLAGLAGVKLFIVDARSPTPRYDPAIDPGRLDQ